MGGLKIHDELHIGEGSIKYSEVGGVHMFKMSPYTSGGAHSLELQWDTTDPGSEHKGILAGTWTSENALTTSSDRRLKTNVRPLIEELTRAAWRLPSASQEEKALFFPTLGEI